ncbi:MAG TPA: hypothetical protein VF454_07670 [Gemmatimonadales bacterium]
MQSPVVRERKSDSATGWLIIAGLAGVGGLAKLLIYVVSQIGNAGPSGAYSMAAIAVMACGAFAAVALGPIGRAIGKRILQGPAGPAATDEDVQTLRAEVDEMRGALVDAQERIDFAERMLAAGTDPVTEERR